MEESNSLNYNPRRRTRSNQNVNVHNQTEVTRYFTSGYAKVISFLIVIGFIVYHGLLRLSYGDNSCDWLLSDGHFQGHNLWQPYGCMIHKYSTSEARMCMHYIKYWGGKNHIAFVGDSRMYQQYKEFVDIIAPHSSVAEKKETEKETFGLPFLSKQEDQRYKEDKLGLHVEFYWRPSLNDSMYKVYTSWLGQDQTQQPDLIVTASATGNIIESNGTEKGVRNMKANLVNIMSRAKGLTESRVLWMLQDPVRESKLIEYNISSVITNRLMDQYNRAAMEILGDSDYVLLWHSSRLVAQGHSKDSEDGYHTGKLALKWDAQILLNYHCNARMNYHDGTCCTDPESLSLIQIIAGSVFGLCLVIAAILFVFKRKLRRRSARSASRGHTPHHSRSGSFGLAGESCFENSCQFFFAMARLGVIIGYFFLCDRTNFFMKENKFYTHVNFMLPFLYLLIVGVFFHEDVTQNGYQPTFLNRDQTDEWKGWMQLVILIYHVVGASEVIPIYMVIRGLVSSYLFLNSYNHFTYFWKTGNFSFYRLSQIIFRLNFIVVLLCFVMNRPYQFYTFVPLCSFWFTLIFIVFALPPRVTENRFTDHPYTVIYLLLKIIILAVIATVLYASEVLFEETFLTRPWKALFTSTDDSISSWRYGWSIDRYSPVAGLVTALAYQLLRRYEIIKDGTSNQNLVQHTGVLLLVCFGSILGIIGYFIFSMICGSKKYCDVSHPYIVVLPILGFILFRNSFGWLRSRYSALFAWFGRFSLELFVCHYHIWLTSDTHGVLVLVPGYPVLNVVLTSFIFVCVAHEVHSLSCTLSLYLVPCDWRYLLRNMFFFFLVLLPVGLSKGMIP